MQFGKLAWVARVSALALTQQNLALLQRRQRLPLKIIAARLGISISQTSRILRLGCPLVTHLDALADLWGVARAEFFYEEGYGVVVLTARENTLVRHFRTIAEPDRMAIESLLKRLAACAGRM